MVETNFKGLVITSLLIGLFIFSILSAGLYLQINNQANQTIMEDLSINNTFTQMGLDLTDIQGQTEGAREGFEAEIPTIGTDSFLFESIISAGKIFTGMWRNVWDLTFGLLITKLGISIIVIGVLVSIILVSIILMAWRVYKSGS